MWWYAGVVWSGTVLDETLAIHGRVDYRAAVVDGRDSKGAVDSMVRSCIAAGSWSAARRVGSMEQGAADAQNMESRQGGTSDGQEDAIGSRRCCSA